MLIDWFTVGAQALNFLILVWLLKRFLYKPILNVIDAREKRIAAELADAAAKQAEAKKERDEFKAKSQGIDDQRKALLGKAADEAKAERERLLDEARKDADGLRAAQQSALQSERIRLGDEITWLTAGEVFAIARKTLSDLASASLEERVRDVFVRRLRGLEGPAKETMAEALKTASEPAIVRSNFDLPAEEKASIQNALNETFSAEVRVRFETGQEGVCGIELTANGQKIAWTISDYLAAFERKVGALLDSQTGAGAK